MSDSQGTQESNSDDKKPKKTKLTPEQAEAMSKKLQESLQSRRPHTWWVVLALLVVCTAGLGLVAYWLYPPPDPGLLECIGFDEILIEGDPIRLRAHLSPQKDVSPARFVRNQKVLFQEVVPFSDWGRDPYEQTATTDAKGWAEVEWAPKREGWKFDFKASHLAVPPKPGIVTIGRAVVWPKDASLLFIEVEETLTKSPPLGWLKTHPTSIPLTTGTADALHQLSAWKPIYVIQPKSLTTYRVMRNWLEISFQAQMSKTGLPVGGVVTDMDFRTGEKSLLKAVQGLQSKFTGKYHAIAHSEAFAQAMLSAKVPVSTMSDALKSDRIPHVGNWAEMANSLK